MFKICIFSDSHGYKENMIHVVEEEKPDFVFCLGDGEPDYEYLKKRHPEIKCETCAATVI